MQMAWQSRTGASAEIYAHIKAVRFYRQGQCLLRPGDQFYKLEQFGVICLIETADMSVGSYQQMAVVVRKAVKHNDRLICSPKHKIFFVILRILQVVAEEAVAACFQPLNITYAPRRPQVSAFQFVFTSTFFTACFGFLVPR
jgi:hypothetical protein